MKREKAPFGTWSSPISAGMTAGTLRVQDVQWDGETLVWSETRTFQSGSQNLLVAQRPGDALHDLTEVDQSVRGGIGYGGGEFTVHMGVAYFAGKSGRLYRIPVTGGRAKAITPAFGVCASPRVSPDGAWIVYVHHYEGADGLALVDSGGRQFPRKLAYGTDFVMQPAWSPDGKQIAYIAWDFPNMPWDGTQLHLITLAVDALGVPYLEESTVIAGDSDTSVQQPEFSPDGSMLAYVSDVSGWWQLYTYNLKTGEHTQITSEAYEHGVPAWRQGLRVYGWVNSGTIAYLRNAPGGVWSMWRVDLESGRHTQIEGLEDYPNLTQIAVAPNSERIAVIGGSAVQTDRLLTIEAPRRVSIRRRASSESIAPEALSKGEPISWASFDGEQAHGLYFPPASQRFESPGAPPLIVMVHGGPTSQQRTTFQQDVQFFATRGYAVLTPNHRGSTGYGRAYMLKHRGMWGIYDVEDSARGATWLATQGLADATKFVIMGGSAGGYTVLQSLVTMPGFYRAGVCAYGISNQFTLALEGGDWKFESRYNDHMIGVLPDDAERYRERSPLFHADKITDPVILFHGDADEAVPIAQSNAIAASLKARGVPHEYHVYPGEGHGWKKAETTAHYYRAITAFLNQYVIFG